MSPGKNGNTADDGAEEAPCSLTRHAKGTHPKVEKYLDKAIDLKDEPPAPSLKRAERLAVVKQALCLVRDNLVHLPTKKALYPTEPVAQLERLHDELKSGKKTAPSDEAFHRRMFDIFYSLRDRHTTYTVSDGRDRVAFLPFSVEQIDNGSGRRYIVSKVFPELVGEDLKAGSELLEWNNKPIADVVRAGEQERPSGNFEAQSVLAVNRLTVRALKFGWPDDARVTITTRKNGRDVKHGPFQWKVGQNPWKAAQSAEIDEENSATSDVRAQCLTKDQDICLEMPKGQYFESVRTDFADIFRARRYRRAANSAHEFGYIRLWSFRLGPKSFLKEFRRLLHELQFPEKGLIIDIRGNPGGKIVSAERILQTLTHGKIEPAPFQFRNTNLNLRICEIREELKAWTPLIQEGLDKGVEYSAGHPMSSEDECNSLEPHERPSRQDNRRVVLIVDALSYSAADVFAAGFQDHEIGNILGIHGRTGGGGASRWGYGEFSYTGMGEYPPLPEEVSFNVAIRRSQRVLQRQGSVVEDFGVQPDYFHTMTKHDVMHQNVDLINKAASMLEGLPPPVAPRRRRTRIR